MFAKFVTGRSYIWLFPLVLAAGILFAFNSFIWIAWYLGFHFFGLMAACVSWFLPVYWVKISEWRSGVALNRMWRAVYPKGTLAFTLNVAGGIILMSTLLVFVGYTFYPRT